MQRTPMPLDVKLMTVATRVLVAGFAGLCLVALANWALRHPAWSVRAITVHGDVAHQNAVSFRAMLAAQMKNRLAASFLTVDLGEVRALFESVPWVRRAVVQREFPNRLRITLEEHQAVAWWGEAGSGKLVNQLGEVFEANPDDGDNLPELSGPAEQAPQVWALYQELKAEFERLDLGLTRLELNDRGTWRAALDTGAQLELGRGSPDELLARTRRFTATLAQLTEKYPGAVQSADLRYPNGYALRMRGVTTLAEEDPKNPAPKR